MKNAASGVQTGKRQGSVIHSNDITNQGGNQVFGIFERLQDIAAMIGAVTEAHMYNNEFMVIEGKVADGRKFRVSLAIEKEEKKDAE